MKLALWQAVAIVILALVAGVIPMVIGILLGFAAFVVTPVVMVFVLVWLGTAIARIAPAARWVGVALATLVLATAFVGAPAATEAVMNGGRHMTLYATVSPAEFPAFTGELAALVKKRGGEAALGQHSEDELKSTTYMLDASIGWIHMSALGSFMPKTEHYPCSGRAIFTVAVQPYLTFVGRPEPVFADLKRALLARGYDVRDQPFPCEPPRPER